jgi:hypothetical protein
MYKNPYLSIYRLGDWCRLLQLRQMCMYVLSSYGEFQLVSTGYYVQFNFMSLIRKPVNRVPMNELSTHKQSAHKQSKQ